MDGTVIIFLVTAITYYSVSKKIEVEFSTLEIPSNFIDSSYFDLVKAIEMSLTSYLPFVIFLCLTYFIWDERKKFSRDQENYKSSSKSSRRVKLKKYEPVVESYTRMDIFLGVITWASLSALFIASIYFDTIIAYVLNISAVAWIALTIYAVMIWIQLGYERKNLKKTNKDTSLPNLKIHMLRLQRLYRDLLGVYIIFCVVAATVTFMVYLVETKHPYETIISSVKKNQGKEGEGIQYKFDILVSDKDGGIWRSVIMSGSKGENKVTLEMSDIFVTKERKNLIVSGVAFKQKFKIIERETELYTEDWGDLQETFQRVIDEQENKPETQSEKVEIELSVN